MLSWEQQGSCGWGDGSWPAWCKESCRTASGGCIPPPTAENFLLTSYLKWKYVELVLMSGAWAPKTLFPVR